MCLYEFLVGDNPFRMIAESTLEFPEWDRSQFEAAMDRAVLEAEPNLDLIAPPPPPPSTLSLQSVSHNGSGGGSIGSAVSPAASIRRISSAVALGLGLPIGGNASSRSGSSDGSPVPASATAALYSPNRRSSGAGSARVAAAAGMGGGAGGNTNMNRRYSNPITSAAAAAAAAANLAASAAAVRDLVQRLLCKDPAQRIGWRGGPSEVMQHPFFSDVNWETLDSQDPVWCPEQEINMKAQSEIGDFSDAKESNNVKLTAEDQKYYENWNFVSESAYYDEIVEFLLYEEIKVRKK